MDRSRFKDYSSKNRRDWMDWLSDQPPAPSARQALRQARVKAAAYQPRFAQPAVAQPASSAKPDLTININLQRIKLPKFKLPRVAWTRLVPSKSVLLAVGVLLMLAVAAYFGLIREGRQPAVTAAAAVRTKPSFQPVAPVSKPQLGDFAGRVTAYDGHRDTYSYADSISGERITISEQPLPSKLGSAEQAVSKIAAQAGASHQITTKNGMAYLKTDQETGAQTAVCSVNGLLLFINSSTRFQDSDWEKYISDLQ